MIVELGVGVLAVGAAGYAFWMLHQRRAMVDKSVGMPNQIRRLIERCTRKLGSGAATENICEICALAGGCELRNPEAVVCPRSRPKVARYRRAGW